MSAGALFGWYAFDQSIYDVCAEYLDEAASLVIKAGTPILKDAAGRVAECGTAPALIYGVAAEDSHNAAASDINKILVYRIRPGDRWVIPVNEALALNMLGVAAGDLGIVKDATTSLWYGSTGDAGVQCRVVDYEKGPTPPGFAIGDTLWAGRVLFHSTKVQVF